MQCQDNSYSFFVLVMACVVSSHWHRIDREISHYFDVNSKVLCIFYQIQTNILLKGMIILYKQAYFAKWIYKM